MIKKTQINDKVREVLNRRINALKRLNTEKGVPFFDSNALEPQDRTNPLEQHLYRSCFAKVSIPSEILNDETVVTIDTRNDYEHRIGTFKGAVNPQTKSFSDFPRWWKENLLQI